jgi:hypothetical protein
MIFFDGDAMKMHLRFRGLRDMLSISCDGSISRR